MLIHRLPSTVDDAVVLGIALPGFGRSTDVDTSPLQLKEGLTLRRYQDLSENRSSIPW